MKSVEENKKKILEALEKNRIGSVVVRYDGSGDDGQITDVDGYMNDDVTQVRKKLGAHSDDRKPKSVDLENFSIDWTEKKSSFQGGTWKETIVPKKVDLSTAIRDFCYDILEEEGFDWVNNDGGYGTITIDAENGKISLDHYQRIMSEERHEKEI